MAVENTLVKKKYTSDGVQVRFAIDFEYLQTTDIFIEVINPNGEITIIGPDDSLYSIDTSTDEVVLDTAITNNYILTLFRRTPIEQPVSLRENAPFSSKDLERGLDRPVLQNQEQADALIRSLRSSIADTGFTKALPDSDSRANQYMAFDENGEPQVMPGPPPRTWNALYTYLVDDIIQYSGSWYICIQEALNIIPGTDTLYWEIYQVSDVYSSAQTYPQYAITSNNGVIYMAKQETKGNSPTGGASDLYWEEINVYGARWDLEVYYKLNDIVNRNGVLYRSLGNDNVGNDPELTLDVSWEEVRTGGGVDVDLVAGEIIATRKPVQISSDGKVYLGSKTSYLPAIGFTTEATTADTETRVHEQGILDGFTSLTPGLEYYLGDGEIVPENSVSARDYRWKMGIAISATELFVKIDKIDPVSLIGQYKVGDIYSSGRTAELQGEKLLNGQVLLVSSFELLVERCYCGDGNNATADYFYRCDNSDGTVKNTTGIYFKIPDARGLTLYGMGTNGERSVKNSANDDVFYSAGDFKYVNDRMQGHIHRGQLDGDGWANATAGSGYTGIMVGVNDVLSGNDYMGGPGTDGTNGTLRTGEYTRGPGFGVNWFIKTSEATAEADPLVGTVQMYGGTTAPANWLFCHGQTVSRSEYADLFDIIGETFGAGDGSTTFLLPDFRNITPYGANSSTRDISGITHPTTALGVTHNDRFQGHWHDAWVQAGGGTLQYPNIAGVPNGDQVNTGTELNGASDAKTDGVNGTPRTGTTTMAAGLGVNFIIKVKNALMIEVFSPTVIEGFVNLIYPVGCYYTQYPDADSNTDAVEFPTAQRPATLFGGTWSEQWSTESVFFRTRGADSDTGRVDGLQGDQLQGHEHTVEARLNSTGGETNGTLSITGAGVSNDNVTIALSSKDPYGTVRVGAETRAKNRRIKVWKRTS